MHKGPEISKKTLSCIATVAVSLLATAWNGVLEANVSATYQNLKSLVWQNF